MNDNKILNLQLVNASFFKSDDNNILSLRKHGREASELGDKGYYSGKQKLNFCFPILKNKVYFILFSNLIRDKLKKN